MMARSSHVHENNHHCSFNAFLLDKDFPVVYVVYFGIAVEWKLRFASSTAKQLLKSSGWCHGMVF